MEASKANKISHAPEKLVYYTVDLYQKIFVKSRALEINLLRIDMRLKFSYMSC